MYWWNRRIIFVGYNRGTHCFLVSCFLLIFILQWLYKWITIYVTAISAGGSKHRAESCERRFENIAVHRSNDQNLNDRENVKVDDADNEIGPIRFFGVEKKKQYWNDHHHATRRQCPDKIQDASTWKILKLLYQTECDK